MISFFYDLHIEIQSTQFKLPTLYLNSDQCFNVWNAHVENVRPVFAISENNFVSLELAHRVSVRAIEKSDGYILFIPLIRKCQTRWSNQVAQPDVCINLLLKVDPKPGGQMEEVHLWWPGQPAGQTLETSGSGQDMISFNLPYSLPSKASVAAVTRSLVSWWSGAGHPAQTRHPGKGPVPVHRHWLNPTSLDTHPNKTL